jgi:PAS domain S-box-containing protein
MPTESPDLADAALPQSAGHMVGRYFFGTTAVAWLVGAALLAVPGGSLSAAWQSFVVGAALLLAAFSALVLRDSRRSGFPMHATLTTSAIGSTVLVQFACFATGQGLRTPALGFLGLIVFTVSATTGRGSALLLGGSAALGIGLLAGAESAGLLVAPPNAEPLWVVLAFQWLLVICASVGGSLIANVLGHYLALVAEREQRFRGLLRTAADWYWEQDRHFRFTQLVPARGGAGEREPPSGSLGRTLWQMPEIRLGADQLDQHRADLEAHRPFNGLRVRQREASGHWRALSISGEPRFDAAGMFHGYWGMARDVTDEARARRAVAASETRYRELFTRSPSPLFLHRRGIVFDANEAAARLFGFADAAAMNDFNIVAIFPPGETRVRALERMAQIEYMAVGEGMPVADYQVRSIDGRLLNVQSTMVRVDTASGPANLSIFFDITARQAAESALRRSEAMLSHLFATSPDCITVTEMASGRYAMVNPAFCRLTGFDAAEVVGRTAAELGLWQDQHQFDRLLTRLDRDGTVADLPAVAVARSGELVSMLLAAGRFVMDQRDYLVVNARDVTESERTRLQHSAILERASIGIAFTQERRFLQSNPFFERMFGWSRGELIDLPAAVIWADNDEYEEIDALSEPLLGAGHPFETERRMRRRDGTEFWCRLLAQAVDRTDPRRGGTIWIAEDVTERRRLDEALAAARDAAEAASRAKSAFLANTSHEIRTPLNGLIGLARLSLEPDLAPQRRHEFLTQLLDSAQSLGAIMSDILDVSKIEAGKITLEDTPFDLRETLHRAQRAHESLAAAKGLGFTLRVDPSLPATVRGDPVRVRQILSNFISNALKFTEHGSVSIAAAAGAGGAVRLSVTDTGPGVNTQTQARLFAPFTQGDSSTTRRFGGTGLGLSICRELAHLMGGVVGVESHPGAGSTFWAELPLAAADATLASTEPGPQDIEGLNGIHVLVAEDNPVNMMIAVALLERWGVRAVQAADGRAAVDAVRAAERAGDPFDAVLMDVQMPEMSGHEAARELRRDRTTRALPILALTAAALVSEREEAFASGMNAFLTKPIDADKLLRTLAGLVKRSSGEPA